MPSDIIWCMNVALASNSSGLYSSIMPTIGILYGVDTLPTGRHDACMTPYMHKKNTQKLIHHGDQGASHLYTALKDLRPTVLKQPSPKEESHICLLYHCTMGPTCVICWRTPSPFLSNNRSVLVWACSWTFSDVIGPNYHAMFSGIVQLIIQTTTGQPHRMGERTGAPRQC